MKLIILFLNFNFEKSPRPMGVLKFKKIFLDIFLKSKNKLIVVTAANKFCI